MQFLGLQIGDSIPDDMVPLEGKKQYGSSRNNSKKKSSQKECSIYLLHNL